MTTYSNIRYAAAGVTEYATADDLPTTAASGSQAFVTGSNRLYLWNGTGWYNIALINTNPSISGVSSSYALAIDGTPTTVTIVASDPEGIPITYSLASDTSGSTATVVQGTGASTNVFTITPSTSEANVGTFTLTFRASDGVNIATAPAEFSLAFQVVNSHYTSALITSVGADNAVNNAFIDSSSNSHTITVSGDAHQTTFSPYRHGGYSTYFDGTGDYLLPAANASFALGTGNFTIEFWMYAENISSAQNIWDQRTGAGFTINLSSSKVGFYSESSPTGYVVQSAALNNNQWYHVAFVRTGSAMVLYLNGVSVATGTSASDYTDNSPKIGVRYSADQQYFIGYLADVRSVKGTAVYTADFTPPTARLTAVTNTSLLTCHLPYIVDGSTNEHAITVAGNTSTQPFSPYDYSPYSSAANGGSMSFDGNGDYVTAPSNAAFDFGTGDFTVETWVYYDAMPSGNGYPNSAWILGGGPANSNTGFDIAIGSTNVQVGLVTFASLNINVAHGMSAGRWYHLAVVRNGNTLTCYKDGSSFATADVTGVTANALSTGIAIAAAEPSGSTSGNPNGYYSDVRVVKGTAVYTADFTPPTAPLTAITGTSLLLKGTNAGIIDKSQTAQAITLKGNAKSSTTAYKYLTSSMAFDGTGDYIDIPVEDQFGFGTGDFTVEFWFNYTGTMGTRPMQLGTGVNGSSHFSGWAVRIESGNSLQFERYSGGHTNYTFGTFSSSAGSWHHLAITRAGTTLRGFIDGTQIGSDLTSSLSFDAHNTTDPLRIGWGYDGRGNFYWQGYMSDIRLTKGLARYTSAFTPPTAALKG